MARAEDSASPDTFWESDEAAQLPDAQPEGELPPDDTEQRNPAERICEACGEGIYRAPGQKGRLPRFHPECKPAKGTTTSDGPRPVRVSAKDRQIAEEIEAALANVEGKLRTAVALMMLVDPFDAFVIHVNTPELIKNLRVVLMRFPWLRQQASNASAGASLFGLIMTVFTIALPIAAHHKLIPSKRVTQVLLNLPGVMLKLQSLLANGEDMTQVLLEHVREQMKREHEAKQRVQTATESVNASPTR